MPPTESQLLTRFLLPPAPLTTSLPLSKFTSLFPPSLHANPSIKTLHNDLQLQREADISLVRKNIVAETERGKGLRRELRRARSNTTRSSTNTTSGNTTTTTTTTTNTTDTTTTNPPNPPPHRQPPAHTLHTLQKALEAEIATLEAETTRILQDIKATVGDLSDLRYGRLAKTPGSETEVREEVLEVLERVRGVALGVGVGVGVGVERK